LFQKFQAVKTILGNSYYKEWPEVEDVTNRTTLQKIRDVTLEMKFNVVKETTEKVGMTKKRQYIRKKVSEKIFFKNEKKEKKLKVI
jgi:hypothetical protein